MTEILRLRADPSIFGEVVDRGERHITIAAQVTETFTRSPEAFEPAPVHSAAAPRAPQSPSSTPGEVERLVDALIEAARFAGKTEAMGAWCAGKAADDLATTRTALLSHISTAARAEGTESVIASWVPQANGVAEAMQDGGHWRSCSGCHETNEGYETGHYPYSPVYGCYVGSGCHECGGIGVIWESPIDEAALLQSAQAASRPAPAPQDLAVLSAAACPGEWCGHLLMEMTEADSDYCDALVNGHRSGRLVERSAADAPTPTDRSA